MEMWLSDAQLIPVGAKHRDTSSPPCPSNHNPHRSRVTGSAAARLRVRREMQDRVTYHDSDVLILDDQLEIVFRRITK